MYFYYHSGIIKRDANNFLKKTQFYSYYPLKNRENSRDISIIVEVKLMELCQMLENNFFFKSSTILWNVKGMILEKILLKFFKVDEIHFDLPIDSVI